MTTNLAITNTFVSGTTIVAADVNTNFTDVATLINSTGVPKVQPGSIVAGNLTAGAVEAGNIAAGAIAQSNLSSEARMPAGAIVDYAGASAPTGWLFAYGQAVSRVTYADLFTALGTAHGVGDGSTTFNLPDFRGRVGVGLDNMGGTDAGRLAAANTLGGTGGTETVALAIAELAAHGHTFTTSTNGNHIHTGSAANHVHTASGGSFAVATSMPDMPRGTSTNFSVFSGMSLAANTNWSGALALTVDASGNHTHTGTADNTGSGTAHNNMQPYILVNKIVKT